MAQVAGPVFVRGATRASADAVDILIALWGVLCKIDPGSKHSSYVSVALIEAFVNDGVDERRPWEETGRQRSNNVLQQAEESDKDNWL